MKKFLSIYTILMISVLNVMGQDLSFSGDNVEWSEGEVTLSDKSLLKGLLKYNTHTGVLSVDNGRETRVFNARAVTSFWYFDAIRNSKRQFYTVTYEDSKGMERPQFFEIIKELDNFALLSCFQPLDLKKKNVHYPGYNYNPGQGQGYTFTKTAAVQKEILYFMNTAGDIDPYLVVENEEMSRDFISSKTKSKIRSKIIDKDLLENYLGNLYTEVKTYAKKNDLDFDEKEDLMLILDYYKGLKK